MGIPFLIFMVLGIAASLSQTGFIYAPKTNERGTMLQHWFNVKLVKKGDIIFCNNKGKILSVAKALSDGYESVIPNSIEGMWNSYGFNGIIINI